jgi:hypothetical protein
MCKAFRNIEGVSLATFFHGIRLGSPAPRLFAAADGRATSRQAAAPGQGWRATAR